MVRGSSERITTTTNLVGPRRGMEGSMKYFIEPRGGRRIPTRIGDQEDGEGEESKSEAISEGGGGLGGGEEDEGGLGLGF